MPIINQIDEANPKNNRTLDTETGVYLVFREHNGPSRTDIYDIYDEDYHLVIFSEVDGVNDEENRLSHSNHKIQQIRILRGTDFTFAPTPSPGTIHSPPPPNRQGYDLLIANLLSAHGSYYGITAARWGYTDVVDVKFGDGVLEGLKT
ncbi:MAG: hypothetical protein AAFV45_03810 [Pseudomonadota bacterium]